MKHLIKWLKLRWIDLKVSYLNGYDRGYKWARLNFLRCLAWIKSLEVEATVSDGDEWVKLIKTVKHPLDFRYLQCELQAAALEFDEIPDPEEQKRFQTETLQRVKERLAYYQASREQANKAELN